MKSVEAAFLDVQEEHPTLIPFPASRLAPMTSYRDFVQRVAFYRDVGTGSRDELAYVLMGIAGEGGEALDVVKKLLRVPDEEYDADLVKRLPGLIEEVGDVLWYIQAFCNVVGIDIEQLAEWNQLKLEARYPE